MVDKSVQETDYYAPKSQRCAAENLGEQSILPIDYIPLANQLNAYAATNAVHQSVGND